MSTRRSCAQVGSLVSSVSFSPRCRSAMRPPWTPSRSRFVCTDWARRSDSAMLYSAVPRGSVWPTTVTGRETFFRQSPLRDSVVLASVVSADSLKSKSTAPSVQDGGGPALCLSVEQTPFTQSSLWAQSSSFELCFFASQVPFQHFVPAGQSLSFAFEVQRLAMQGVPAGQPELSLQ